MLTLTQLSDLRLSVGHAVNGSSEMKGSTLSLVLRSLDEDGADMADAVALRESIRTAINGDSVVRGLAILEARAWLDQQVDARLAEDVCIDCGDPVDDPDDLVCFPCKVGRCNA